MGRAVQICAILVVAATFLARESSVFGSPPRRMAPGSLLATCLTEPDNHFSQALGASIRFSGIDDATITFEQALDQFALRYRLVFHLNQRALGKDWTKELRKSRIADPKPMPPMTDTKRKVLQRIVDRLPNGDKLAIIVRHKHVEITTKAALQQELLGRYR